MSARDRGNQKLGIAVLCDRHTELQNSLSTLESALTEYKLLISTSFKIRGFLLSSRIWQTFPISFFPQINLTRSRRYNRLGVPHAACYQTRRGTQSQQDKRTRAAPPPRLDGIMIPLQPNPTFPSTKTRTRRAPGWPVPRYRVGSGRAKSSVTNFPFLPNVDVKQKTCWWRRSKLVCTQQKNCHIMGTIALTYLVYLLGG